MTNTTLFDCEYPAHVGRRRVTQPADRFTKRTTYMRIDGKVRLHEKSGMRFCRACVELDADANPELEGQEALTL